MKVYKITIFRLLLLLLFAIAFASCNDETEDDSRVTGKRGEEVSFTLDKDGIRLKVAGNEFEDGDRVGVYAVRGGYALKAFGNYADNKQFIYNGGTFTACDGNHSIYFKKGEKLDFYLYYPYRETISDATYMEFSVNTDQKEDINENELLWATACNDGKADPVSLTFKRCNAVVEAAFEVHTDGATYREVKMSGIATGGIFDLATGAYKEIAEETTSLQMNFVKAMGETIVFKAMLPPQTLQADKLLFSMEDGAFARDIRINEEKELLPGTWNNLNFVTQKHTVLTHVTPDFAGEVFGRGIYSSGTIAQLTTRSIWHDYILQGWYDESGTLLSDEYELNIAVTRDMVIEARYRNQFQLMQALTEGEGLFKFRGSLVYEGRLSMDLLEGQSFDFEAIPDYGHKFRGWYYDDGRLITTDAHYKFVMGDHPVTIIARFEPAMEYRLRVIAEEGYGLIYEDYSGNHSVQEMEVVGVYPVQITCIAEPLPGYRFTGWYENYGHLLTTDKRVAYRMNGYSYNATLSARFEPL